MEPIGQKRWAIAEGYLPGWSHGPQPELASHETACVLNTSDRDAHVETALFFAGCCDMAGAFGFEEGHHDISVACAERRLLPAVREAHDDDTLVITSGYSCREQLAQLSGVRPLHTHEVLRAAFTGGDFVAPPEGRRGLAGALRANWPAVAAGPVALAAGSVAGWRGATR